MPFNTRIDITGQQFGRLLVIEPAMPRYSTTGKVTTFWSCICDCGKHVSVRTTHLRMGRISSCGCLKSDLVSAKNTTHGFAATPTYRSWQSMLGRCRNANYKGFINYGGRGITVCDRWAESYVNFLSDMGERPIGLSLDRFPDKNGNYEPNNCRWASRQEQNTNRRNVILIEFSGRSQCAADWAREMGITKGALYARLKKHPIHIALTP